MNKNSSKKLNIGFICVHNSCRSQMAEAIAKDKYGELFNFYSAGSELTRSINADALRIIISKYGIDMLKTQKPKFIADLPNLDIIISMGCEVQCPVLSHQYYEDWNLADPSGQPDQVFYDVIDSIEKRLKELVKKLNNDEKGRI